MCLEVHTYINSYRRLIFGSAMTPLEVPEMQKFCGCAYLSRESFGFSNLRKFVNFSLKRKGYRQEQS